MPMTYEKCLNESPNKFKPKPVRCGFCDLPTRHTKTRCVIYQYSQRKNLRQVAHDRPWYDLTWIGWLLLPLALLIWYFGYDRPPIIYEIHDGWTEGVYFYCHKRCERWLRSSLKHHRRYSWFAKRGINEHFENRFHFMDVEKVRDVYEQKTGGRWHWWPPHHDQPWWH